MGNKTIKWNYIINNLDWNKMRIEEGEGKKLIKEKCIIIIKSFRMMIVVAKLVLNNY